jgi:hypothetical protein
VAASACNLEHRTANLELNSERLGYLSGTNAAGANLDAADSTVVDSFDLLQVRMPGPSGFVVCMADVIAEAGAFTANIAYF